MSPQSRSTLSKFVDELPSRGRYTFTREEVAKTFKKTDDALMLALNRLKKSGRIISPRRGFYVVVSLEYKLSGGPPPTWFINDLTDYLGCSYYIGLLSAAEIHGAAHQRPQEFQVMTDIWQRPIMLKRSRIRFFRKRNLAETPTQKTRTVTGDIRVSTPEATALDLVRYWKDAGYLNNVATVLSELAASMNGARLVAAAKKHTEISVVQRLGYLLDLVGQSMLSEGLAQFLSKGDVRLTNLRPDLENKDAKIDSRWSLYINDEVEPDL